MSKIIRIVFFVAIFNNFNVNIIAFCKTRLCIGFGCLNIIDGYGTHCNISKCQGGGVLFYVKSRLGSEELHEFTFLSAHLEAIIVSFSVHAKKTLLETSTDRLGLVLNYSILLLKKHYVIY